MADLTIQSDSLGPNAIATTIVWLFLAAFVAVYGVFIWDIWKAQSGVPPAYSEVRIDGASAMAAILGSAFAVALGIKKRQEVAGTGPNVSIGAAGNRTLIPTISRQHLTTTVGLWVYFGVGVAALATYILHSSETPEAVKGLAVAIAGYFATVVTNVFGAVQVSNG